MAPGERAGQLPTLGGGKDKTKTAASQGGVCVTCGRRGHKAADCPHVSLRGISTPLNTSTVRSLHMHAAPSSSRKYPHSHISPSPSTQAAGAHAPVSKQTSTKKMIGKRVVVEGELSNDMVLVIDVSGSMMAGGKLTAAKEGVRLLFTEVLDKCDRMSVWVFNNHAQRIIPLTQKSDVDIDDVLRRIPEPSGGTAMFDAVDGAMNEIKGVKGRYRSLQLVVLTDGLDGSSRRVSESELAQRLQKPGLAHFHLIAVAVGPEAAKTLTPLCAPQHCHLIKVNDAAVGIKKAFDTCVTTIREIRQRVHTEVKSQKAVTDSRGNKKDPSERKHGSVSDRELVQHDDSAFLVPGMSPLSSMLNLISPLIWLPACLPACLPAWWAPHRERFIVAA
jgi:Mg-chelatase subunit ChlD